MGIFLEKQVGSSDCTISMQPEPLPLERIFGLTSSEVKCLHQLKRLIAEDEAILKSGFADDPNLLLAMVRGRKCNLKKTFSTLKNYVHVRTIKYPTFFREMSPQKIKYLLDRSSTPRMSGLLRHPDKKGRRVILDRSRYFDTHKHNTDILFEKIITSGEQMLRGTTAPKCGVVVVTDTSGFGFKQAREITLPRLYMVSQIFASAYPVPLKGFHVINNSYLSDVALKVVKKFLPRKLRQRIHLHGNNYESLYEHVPREILPQSVGGYLTEEEAFDEDFEQSILDNTHFYEKMGVNW